MPVVLIVDGYRFMIYVQDHEPPHVHILHRGCEAIIEIESELMARSNYGYNRREMRAITRIVMANRNLLIRKWGEIHG